MLATAAQIDELRFLLGAAVRLPDRERRKLRLEQPQRRVQAETQRVVGGRRHARKLGEIEGRVIRRGRGFLVEPLEPRDIGEIAIAVVAVAALILAALIGVVHYSAKAASADSAKTASADKAGTNAGGPHCLSYGTTTNHILRLQYVDASGAVHTTSLDDSGYDLTGLLVGSEGTLGIVTEIDVRLLRLPEAVNVCVAAFGDVESASEAVSAIIGAGIVPVALEIMDKVITRAVEAHYHAGFPEASGAVLLVEVAGALDDMAQAGRTIEIIARTHGALSWRSARDAKERERLWAARKGAAGAIGRIAPNYYIQDACVPRTKLPQVMREVQRIAREHRLPVGNVFHAGDGNLHPLLIFDRRDARQVQAVIDAGNEILATCISMGGTISGEHGIGYEKRQSLSLVFTTADLAAMARVRDVFDPLRALNPDKIFPSGAVCGEVTAASSAA